MPTCLDRRAATEGHQQQLHTASLCSCIRGQCRQQQVMPDVTLNSSDAGVHPKLLYITILKSNPCRVHQPQLQGQGSPGLHTRKKRGSSCCAHETGLPLQAYWPQHLG